MDTSPRDNPLPTKLQIALLGGFAVRHGSGDVIELKGQKDRALLGFLALSPGVPWPRDKLASMLWGDAGDKQARDSLKQALLRLRRTFDAVRPAPLIANRQTITLAHDAAMVDVTVFEDLLDQATLEASKQAADIYRGDLLDGVEPRSTAFDDWLMVERQRLRDKASEALNQMMSQALADGRRDLAMVAARRLLSLDPLHEAACRCLMQGFADRGEGAQALRLFETLKERLQQELAVTPERETVNLYQAIRHRRHQGVSPAAPPADGLVNGLPEAPSIAVLPFENMSADSDQDYFADGLAEDIITDLSRISALFVAARNSVFTLKGRQLDAQQVARALNVRYVLEGSVRKAAGRVRITAQLVDGATGGQLWAQRYDRSLDDMFALQDEIAENIVDVLSAKLLPEELKGIVSRSTTSMDAYHYYSMGRGFYLRGIDKHSLRIAKEMFVKAIEIDPDYAIAYAALAVCESYLSMDLSKNDPDTSFESCLNFSLRAQQLDPNLAEAFAAKGLALYVAGLYDEASAEFEQAIRLGPHLFEAHFFYARNCHLQGRRAEAADLFERAAALRLNDFRSLGLFSEECQALGRDDEFLAAARRCVERLEPEIEAHPDNAGALAFGSAVLADLGEHKKAQDWADRAVLIGPDDCMVHYNVARTLALLGQHDRALDALDRAYDCSPVFQRRLAMWMRYDEDFDRLRLTARFGALVSRLNQTLDLPT
ncbi:MAG: BTAD domain-containing putative transcriptional regulator [Pseudomonadota bacterium]